ncbi:MAG: hypothetical protein IPG01_18850 [Chitinophagaceae bacterium]|nr:hypothetical protein [Chitinophagaceae bacterium]
MDSSRGIYLLHAPHNNIYSIKINNGNLREEEDQCEELQQPINVNQI